VGLTDFMKYGGDSLYRGIIVKRRYIVVG